MLTIKQKHWEVGRAKDLSAPRYIYVHIYTVYIHFYTISCFISNAIRMSETQSLTSTVFGVVYSDRSVVVLVHKYFSFRPSTSFNSISIITNCMYATMSEFNITAYINNSFGAWGSVVVKALCY